MKEQIKRWAGALAVVLAFGVMGIPDAMAATATTTFWASDHATPGTVSAGDVRLIASYSFEGAAQVGIECDFRVTSTNDESVHVNNFVTIVTGGQTITVLGTEDGVGGVHVSDTRVVLGDTVDVYNHIGARVPGELPVGTSVELEIAITCTIEDDTTSTTANSTTTSSTGSTTTVPSSTSIPPTASTSSSLVTTTTAPTGSTTTVPPVTSPPTLPYTGLDDHLPSLAFAGAMLALLGGFLLRARSET